MNVFPEITTPLLAGAFVLFACVLRAQPAATRPQNPDPEVAALLAKVAANRGFAAGAKVPTLQMEGTYTVSFGEGAAPVAKGTYIEHFDGTDDARHVSNMGPMGSMERGTTKDLVWEVDPGMGAKVRRGAQAAHVRRYCALLRGEDPRKVYREFEKTGVETVDGRKCVVLRATASEGSPDTWFVAEDGTVARVDMLLPAPESADASFKLGDMLEARIHFAEWRQFDGARLPQQRTLHMGPARVQFTCTKVAVGEPIEPAVFAPPKAVLAVKPESVEPAFGADGKTNYQVVERPAQPVATIRVKCKPNEISAQLGVVLPEVNAHLNAVGAKMAGPPFSRYHAWSDTEVDVEAGFPIQAPIAEKGRVKNSELPGGKVLMAWHVGPYDKLGPAHEALRQHAADKKLAVANGPWEIYWTDPGMVPDAAKWKTQLFLPLR